MNGLDHYQIGIIIIFVIGYAMIAFEDKVHINKATTALMMAILCWAIQFANKGVSGEVNTTLLGSHVANISQVIFFLLGAVAIVEVIDSHNGFRIISKSIRMRGKRELLWLVGLLTFFLSSVLDNLTTTILMVSLVRRIIDDGQDRLLIGGGVVIAANAGGAWTPIGDITTTMLWIGGQVSTFKIMQSLFIPSLVCVSAALLGLSFLLKGEFESKKMTLDDNKLEPFGGLIFILGIGSLIFVPIFKLWTGLPPFMGILFWIEHPLVCYRYCAL